MAKQPHVCARVRCFADADVHTAGVAFSGAVLDACGVCLPPGHAGVNASCGGCDGVPHSGAVFDACCVCAGNATRASACYREMLASPGAAATPLPSYEPSGNVSYDAFFSALGQARVDACGECRGWGYNGVTCAGCDGVPLSGVLRDPCGVCNGTCACAAGALAAAGSCGTGGASPACALVQTAGPGTHGTPIYPSAPQNRPGLPAWIDAVNATCAPAGAPPPPPPPAEWVVLLYGREFGPFTLTQLRGGTFNVRDTQNKTVTVALTPAMLVGRVATRAVVRNISYGVTSALPARAAAWAASAAALPGVVGSPTAPGVPNMVQLLSNETNLQPLTLAGGSGSSSSAGVPTLFAGVGRIPELQGAAYPPCSGVSFRRGAQRTHGKRTGLNARGLLVSQGIPDTFSGLKNQPWNPWDEFIYDVANAWEDQTCVCHEEWVYTPEAVPPTCPREWAAWDHWRADTHVGPTAPGSPLALRVQRSLADSGTARPSGGGSGAGGFVLADAGGIGAGAYGAAGDSLAGVYGSDATRGPWRITAQGTLTFTTTAALPVRACTPACAKSYASLTCCVACARSARPGAHRPRGWCRRRRMRSARCGTSSASCPSPRASPSMSHSCSARPRSAAQTSAQCVNAKRCAMPAAPETHAAACAAEPALQRGGAHAAPHHVLGAARRWLRDRAARRRSSARRCNSRRRWRRPRLRGPAQLCRHRVRHAWRRGAG